MIQEVPLVVAAEVDLGLVPGDWGLASLCWEHGCWQYHGLLWPHTEMWQALTSDCKQVSAGARRTL